MKQVSGQLWGILTRVNRWAVALSLVALGAGFYAASSATGQVGSRSAAGASARTAQTRTSESAQSGTTPGRSTPSARQALQISPVQKDVDCDVPAPEELDQCTMEAFRSGKQAGWLVRAPDGTILRRFVDTNGDNMVDQWCYYKDGLEVYRDIDSNFNGKADQYRWFHTAGTRWGVDVNEDGRIDSWRMISAEEVSAEVVAALAYRDFERFQRLVLSADELKALGLGPEKTKEIQQRLATLAEKFRQLVTGASALPAEARWVQFSGNRPGIVPAGTDQSSQDIRVYENVIAVAEANQKMVQILLGTLIAVGETWKLVDAPQILGDTPPPMELSGFFFRARTPESPQPTPTAMTDQLKQLVELLEKTEQALAQASSPSELASLHQQKAEILERLSQAASSEEERALWMKQLADELSYTVQEGSYPQAAERLERLYQAVRAQANPNLIAYVRYRQLTGEYGRALRQPGTDYVKLQQEWIQKLELFVKEFGQLPESAEALLQLAVARELAGEEEEAKKWYSMIVERFPNTPPAVKARGALRRLGMVGQPFRLRGSTANGQPFDIAQLQGKVVLVYYWASWCEPCRADLATLKDLLARFGRYGFTIVGVNLDNNPEAMQQFIQEYQVNWPQLYEPGGLESSLANDLGIVTVPTLILIDQQGRVVHRNLQTATLESELRRLIR
ncbi:MAG: redoxin family protein [Thermoguttaceae bacterium]|nr:redoxin family protein [Thermoguttaceae bacterium]MDW8079124.1 redoxin family protein [Thermoguttaceae bacterium]